MSSPTSSINGQMQEVTLGFFTDTGKKKKFDFGIGELAIEDDIDEEMEVLDPPDLEYWSW